MQPSRTALSTRSFQFLSEANAAAVPAPPMFAFDATSRSLTGSLSSFAPTKYSTRPWTASTVAANTAIAPPTLMILDSCAEAPMETKKAENIVAATGALAAPISRNGRGSTVAAAAVSTLMTGMPETTAGRCSAPDRKSATMRRVIAVATAAGTRTGLKRAEPAAWSEDRFPSSVAPSSAGPRTKSTEIYMAMRTLSTARPAASRDGAADDKFSALATPR
mmetsp:Transcript_10287/g.31453  ORF Transcript_10287/g.31453 Transcript_10287/m.31453 type:complete len:220 (+) Transcript_10287:1130-1789(+)